MKGYRISLIRHGRTEANDKGIYIGRTDYPLSQKGISELYNKLDEFEYPHVGKVYSSPLQRCTETAEILFPDSSVQIVENLIEMDFGDLRENLRMNWSRSRSFWNGSRAEQTAVRQRVRVCRKCSCGCSRHCEP